MAPLRLRASILGRLAEDPRLDPGADPGREPTEEPRRSLTVGVVSILVSSVREEIPWRPERALLGRWLGLVMGDGGRLEACEKKERVSGRAKKARRMRGLTGVDMGEGRVDMVKPWLALD